MSQSPSPLDFSEHNSAAVVASRFRAAGADPAAPFLIMIDRLRSAVRQARPSCSEDTLFGARRRRTGAA